MRKSAAGTSYKQKRAKVIIQEESGKEVIYQTESSPPVGRTDRGNAPPLGQDPDCDGVGCTGRLKKGVKEWHKIKLDAAREHTVSVFDPEDLDTPHDTKSVEDNDRVRIKWKAKRFYLLLNNQVDQP